jgi:uncharacterized protein YecE (DUF72 family)
MRAYVGTSGFSYPAWKGSFYPERIKPADMLTHYALHLPAVEINNTFYRMPRPSLLEGWRTKVPDSFRFVLKAPRRITHLSGLSTEALDAVRYLWETATVLGPCLGPFLFQLPPHFAKDLDRLRAFVSALPSGMRVALEVRHRSWLDDDVYGVLRDQGVALVHADMDDADRSTPLLPTADFGYLRLRAKRYDDAALQGFAHRMANQPWREVYAFFKHEDQGEGPRLAKRLLALF